MIKAGTTEGRFRMAMPDILAGMKDVCPDEAVRASMADAVTLKNQVIDGKLDFAFSGLTEDVPEALEYSLLYVEHLYFVISDNMLDKYLKDRDAARAGEIDVRSLTGIPVSRSLPGLHCMQILDELLNEEGQTAFTFPRSLICIRNLRSETMQPASAWTCIFRMCGN